MNEKTRFIEIISILKNSALIRGFTPQKLCETIIKLGPTFIKIGQIMSNRYDLLPKEYCDALANLRANVTPMDFKEVNQILKEEFGNPNEIFQDISKNCIGSASIAQVHKAKLKSGEDVVIKVQRRNIYEIMSTDVKLFKRAIRLLHLNLLIKIVDLNSVLDEMYNVAKEEMDFEIEAKNLEEFRQNNCDIVYIGVPKVYKSLVTKKVLIMEYVEGINVTDKQELLNSGYDLEEIGLKLANNYIKQALDDGFFHADPHPDNMCIREGKIMFLDLGMMGRLSSRNKQLLKNAMNAIVANDTTELERILLNISTTTGSINHIKLRNEIQKILDKNVNENIENINIVEFMSSVSKVLRESNIKLDKNITLLMRGICVIEGTLELISPNINLIMVFENKIRENTFDNVFSKGTLMNTGRNIVSGVNSLCELPTELLSFVKDINRGETKIDIEMANSDKQVDKLEKMLHQLVIGLLDAAVLLGACMVDNKILRAIYIILGTIFTVWLFIQMAKDHFHSGY